MVRRATINGDEAAVTAAMTLAKWTRPNLDAFCIDVFSLGAAVILVLRTGLEEVESWVGRVSIPRDDELLSLCKIGLRCFLHLSCSASRKKEEEKSLIVRIGCELKTHAASNTCTDIDLAR
jgi:hypothetical protein